MHDSAPTARARQPARAAEVAPGSRGRSSMNSARRTYEQLADDSAAHCEAPAGRRASTRGPCRALPGQHRSVRGRRSSGRSSPAVSSSVVNPQTKADKLAFILADSDAAFLIAEGHSANVAAEAVAQRGSATRVFMTGSAARGSGVPEPRARRWPQRSRGPRLRETSPTVWPHSSTRPARPDGRRE